MNYNDHFQQILYHNGPTVLEPTLPVINAAKALDYMDGHQEYHMELLLDDPERGIKEWRKRGIRPVIENLTGKVIKRSALNYQEDPKRKVWKGAAENEAISELYTELLTDCDFTDVVREFDKVVRLLKAGIIIPWYIKETGLYKFSILHRGNCDVDIDERTGEIISVLYTTSPPPLLTDYQRNQAYVYIDKDQIVDLVDTGGSLKMISKEPNPYGFVPVAYCYDDAVPRTGFWPSSRYEDLVLLNEALNFLNTWVFHGGKYQIFGVPVTNAQIPDGTVVAPDAPLKLKGEFGVDVYFEFKSPQGNLDQFLSYIKDLCKRVGDTWGVNLDVEGSGSADSGFKLVVEELWNLETRKDRRHYFTSFERRLYKTLSRMGAVTGIKLPEDGVVYPEWVDVALPVNEMEQWTIAQQKMTAGVLSRRQYLRQEYPDMSEEDITKWLQEIDDEKTSAMELKQKFFGDVLNADKQAGTADNQQ